MPQWSLPCTWRPRSCQWCRSSTSAATTAGYLALAHTLAEQGVYQESWGFPESADSRVPPLYPALLSLLIFAGFQSLGAFKVLSAFLTGTAVLFCYLWVRKLHGVCMAFVVALLLGISPGLVNASHWVLSEPLFLALIAVMFWLLTPAATVSAPAPPVRRHRSGLGLPRTSFGLGSSLGSQPP